MQPSTDKIRDLYEDKFAVLLQGTWSEWRRNYIDQIRTVAAADEATWMTDVFQKRLWDDASVANIGPGQAVTVVGAYTDQKLARVLWDAKGALDGLPLERRGERLQALYDQILSHVYPNYTRRRPKARLVRLLAAMFPEDMTCLMEGGRTWALQRTLGAVRLPGDFVAQNPSLRDRIRDAVGPAVTDEAKAEQAMFNWFLWEELVDKPETGAVPIQPPHRVVTALPALSLLPASAQRRGLACLKDNVGLLMAMLREAEQGIGRPELIQAILSEAPQLNANSAATTISQAMGGLGLLRLDGDSYRPTDRGRDMLAAPDPVPVLRAPLVGRVFGMGHLLLMVQREPGKLRTIDAAERLMALVPTWTSTQPGAYIVAWAKITGLVQLEDTGAGNRLELTEDGEDYADALPDDFESVWRIQEAGPPLSNVGPLLVEEAASYGAAQIAAEGCFLPVEEVEAAVALLRRRKNLILQGPPGTGKTWLAKRLGYALMGLRDPGRLTALQFQPSLSYEDFVRGWRPNGTGGLQLVDGIFLEAVHAARNDPGRPHVLVIEEINRGNPAQILGEMLTLIEDSKRRPEEALRLAYATNPDERIYVPDNLHIIGTMNLADRSLALVDLALRRRFAFLSLSPLLNEAWRNWSLVQGCPASLLDAIQDRFHGLNAAIAGDKTLGEQFRVGHSFVTPSVAPGPSDTNWTGWYRDVVRAEVAPLLEEYWYDRPDEAKDQVARLLAGF